MSPHNRCLLGLSLEESSFLDSYQPAMNMHIYNHCRCNDVNLLFRGVDNVGLLLLEQLILGILLITIN